MQDELGEGAAVEAGARQGTLQRAGGEHRRAARLVGRRALLSHVPSHLRPRVRRLRSRSAPSLAGDNLFSRCCTFVLTSFTQGL